MSEEHDMSDPDNVGGPTNRPVPPYEGRRESADMDESDDTNGDGANVAGATGPVEDDEMKSTPKEDTPRGAEA